MNEFTEEIILVGYLTDENSVQVYLLCLYSFRVMSSADFQLFVSTIFYMRGYFELNWIQKQSFVDVLQNRCS